MLDFPTTPAVGQKYPPTPISGVPTYAWDGEKWTTAVPPEADAVRYGTAQSLTSTQQTQARTNIYAAPYDAMAYSGMQINGGMEVSQELGTIGTNVTGKYALDGWAYVKGGTSVCTLAQVQSSAAEFLACGINYKALLTVQTAEAAIAAGSVVVIVHLMEGYRIAKLGWGTSKAQPATVSFWSSASRAGTYTVSIRNKDNTRSFCAGYTQAAAGAFQYNTVTIPGCVDGGWEIGNLVGFQLSFCAASGTTYTTSSANTWVTGNFIAVSGQVNGIAATSDTLAITGVTVLPGTQAPTAAQGPNIMRPYDQELGTCQRYYWKSFAQATPVAQNAGLTSALASDVAYSASAMVVASVTFPTNMRTTPTLVTYAPDATTANWSSTIPVSGTLASENTLQIRGSTGTAQGARYFIHATADARL